MKLLLQNSNQRLRNGWGRGEYCLCRLTEFLPSRMRRKKLRNVKFSYVNKKDNKLTLMSLLECIYTVHSVA